MAAVHYFSYFSFKREIISRRVLKFGNGLSESFQFDFFCSIAKEATQGQKKKKNEITMKKRPLLAAPTMLKRSDQNERSES